MYLLAVLANISYHGTMQSIEKARIRSETANALLYLRSLC